jgi:aminoglycoside phosphotransferase (APT) family kinase protein
MLDDSFVTRIARSTYGLEPKRIAPLDQLALDWRGLYLLHDAQDGAWVLRMLRLPGIRDALGATAELLGWLEGQGYPAPRVRRTVDQQLVAEVGGWATMLLSYVDGAVIDAEPQALGHAAAALGRLHALPLPTDQRFPHRRCHPDALAETAQSLATYGPHLPHPYEPLVTDLHATTVRLQQLGPARCVTHGDCWYRNAVQTPAGEVVLIDWDRAGVGHPLSDLAYLLFSSHFDVRQPLVLRPDEAIIRVILARYGQYCQVPPTDGWLLADAMRYLIAFQLGEYAADLDRVRHPDFPIVLQKLQARADAVESIATVAKRVLMGCG